MGVQTNTGKATRSRHVQSMLHVRINIWTKMWAYHVLEREKCQTTLKQVRVHQIHPNSPLLINDDQRTLVRPSVVQSLDLTLLPCRPSSHLYLKSDMRWRSYDVGSWELQGRFPSWCQGCNDLALRWSHSANIRHCIRHWATGVSFYFSPSKGGLEAIIQKPVISFSTWRDWPGS